MRYTLSDLLVLTLVASLYGLAIAYVPLWTGTLIDWVCLAGILVFVMKGLWDALGVRRCVGDCLARWRTPGGSWAHALFPLFGFVTWWVAAAMSDEESTSLMVALMATLPCHAIAAATLSNRIGTRGTQIGPALFSHEEYTLRLAPKRRVLRIRRRAEAIDADYEALGEIESAIQPRYTAAPVPESALEDIAAAIATLASAPNPLIAQPEPTEA